LIDWLIQQRIAQVHSYDGQLFNNLDDNQYFLKQNSYSFYSFADLPIAEAGRSANGFQS